MIWQASKFSGNVLAIEVELLGLVVAEARVVQCAAIKCDDERDEAVLTKA